MESLDVVVKAPSPSGFSLDMFSGALYCYSSNGSVLRCVFCSLSGTVDCLSLRLKTFMKCVEEEEVTTAVADVGKSSERDSDKPHLESPERSSVLNP